MASVSLVLVFNSEGKLLLQKRKDSGLFSICGGHLEGNETPEECARRETKEETGLDLASCTFLKHQVNEDGVELFCFTGYVNGNQTPHNRLDPDDEVKEDGFKWVSIEGGLDKKYFGHLHGPESAEGGNIIKQLFDLKEKVATKDQGGNLNKAEDEVSRLLYHNDPNERLMGLKLNTLTPDHLNLAAHDSDPNIWRTAIDNPLFDEDTALRFMGSKNNPLEQQSYLLSKPDRVKSHFLDSMWRNSAELPLEQRSKIVDVIAVNPLAESNLIRDLYMAPTTNGLQRTLLVGHPNCPEDILENAMQLLLLMPSKESLDLASIAAKNPKAPVDFLNNIIKMAVEQPNNIYINSLAEAALQSSPFADALLEWLIIQNKLRPNSNVAVLIAMALSGPMGNPFNIAKVFKEAGPDVWGGNKNAPIPHGITEAQMDTLVEYALQKDNKVLLNRLMDNKAFTGRHLDIIFRTNLLATQAVV